MVFCLPYNKCISEGMMVGVSCITTSYFILVFAVLLFRLNKATYIKISLLTYFVTMRVLVIVVKGGCS